ncbi:MAG: cysteine desulfurase [Acidobacteria bacterium]|nr:cysteine desulfurase [Acidobacteriota bacterium]
MSVRAPFNLDVIRADFPILRRKTPEGRTIVYLDNAATSQKPESVIEAISQYYRAHNANVHRGVHVLSEEATQAYESARQKVAQFLNAPNERNIVFLRGTTEAINLLAQSYGRPNLGPGDEILISHMEHHSNIVPWQVVCRQTGAELKVVPIDEHGVLDIEAFEAMLSERTRIFSCVHVSNALGTINPIKRMVSRARSVGAITMVDGAQAAPHMPIDVQDLDCDFYAISGHKMFGPTGIGALYGRAELLESMDPYQAGGEMIKYVSFEKTVYNEVPHKFEAGTPNIAGAVGLGAAVDYLRSIDFEAAMGHEEDLLEYGRQQLERLPEVRLIGTAKEKAGVLSFWMEGTHPHDVGTILSHEAICVRTGHHCAQPVMQRFGIPATIRASLAFYNNHEDLDALIEGLKKVKRVMLG